MPDHDRTRTPAPATATPSQAPAPRSAATRAREQVRGSTYAEGRAALQPPEAGAGPRPPLPASGDEAARLAQQSFVSASVGVTTPEARTLHSADGLQVVLDAGTRLSASLSDWGVDFGAHPGILLKLDYKPDLRVKSLHWSFRDARFVVDAETDWLWDPFSLMGNAAERKIQAALDQQIRPHLPEAMKRPGYSPKSDRDLAGTVSQLANAFAFVGGDGPAAGADPRRSLTDPSASLGLALPDDLHVPLGVQNLELLVKKGQRLDLHASARGTLASPIIESASLNAYNEAITVLPQGGNFKELKKLVLNSVTIRRGGAFTFDYDLTAEQMGNGLFALLALGAMAAGEHVGEIPRVKLEGIRNEIDTALQREVPPRFKEMLLRYDGMVPGLSLKSLFGV